ncbi:efflux RND transporter periplasmic adaptor subunit [Vibrio scophthalmi]|uniref:Antibiotic efflux pump periplasmic linker protein ArpA n=1 Tax=Vibrio scophthalmi TaxID=45658 RepID=A0A1B1NNM9_9VIBR|nr:efflux RND transporter periplasmic adaptor subunit [Vibrio scophthalmi]ANS85251.1 Antibiotic efflux pump periplasmic linker protein ArpA [Vibrio scophthalmi]ANU36186.1 Antibiotic efflux pump periplasmic linker protein ArpA [Vibrio scophthalmi]
MRAHLLLLATLGMIQGCSEEPPIDSNVNSIRPVKLFNVTEQQANVTASFPGIIQSKNLKEISFTTTGRVTEFPIKEAMLVKAGDVIARLDQRELKNALSKAKSQYQIASDEYQRIAKLAKTGAVSKSSLQAKQTERDLARVQLDSAQQALNDSTLFAPIDGIIAQTFIEKDQVISSGQTVAILIGEGELEASIDVPGKFLALLHQNSMIEGQPSQSWISLDSLPSQRFPAEFKEATLVADPTTQTYGLTFAFKATTDILILPGMNVSVDITVTGNESIQYLSIPIDAVGSDSEGTFVWLVDTDSMMVSKQHVTLKEQIGESIAVLEGLSKGDTIVSAGVSQLSEGITVREWK